MAFFGPGVTLIPPHKQGKWRQGWWWRERLPGIITMSVVVLLAVGAGVVGWKTTGDDSGGAAAPSSSSAEEPRTSPPPTPTVQPPLFPDAAKEKSLKGVRAFVNYYFDVLNYTRRTNDVSRLQRIQLEDRCDTCRNQQAIFESIDAEGQRVRGGEYQVQSIAATPVDDDTYTCAADYTVADATLLNADGSTAETLSSENADNRLIQQITWSNDSWQIVAQSDGRVERN